MMINWIEVPSSPEDALLNLQGADTPISKYEHDTLR